MKRGKEGGTEWGLRGMLTGVLVVAGVFLAGCNSVSQQPFTDFSKSAQALRANSDKLVRDLQETATEEFVANVLHNPALVPGLKLKRPDMGVAPTPPASAGGAAAAPAAQTLSYDQQLDAFYRKQFVLGGLENAPYVAKLPTFRAGLYTWNGGLVSYAAGLEALADSKVVDNDKLNTLASDMNGNLRAGRDTLKLKSISDNDIAIFSTVATELFRAYLRAEQRSELVRHLEAADGQMPLLARGGKEAVQIIALAVWEQYDYQFGKLARTAINSPAPDEPQNPSESDRRKAIMGILDLNIQHAATIQSLEALYNAYGAIPGAHADLVASAKKNGITLTGISNFLGEIQRIDALYESLKGTSSKGAGK